MAISFFAGLRRRKCLCVLCWMGFFVALFCVRWVSSLLSNPRGPLNGGGSNGGVSRSGLVLPFLSFLGLSRFFLGFSPFARRWIGDFPDLSFSLSRPIKSPYEEQSRKGPRHNLDLSPKKWETSGFGNPQVHLLSKPPPQKKTNFYLFASFFITSKRPKTP